jgi:hypothetical protein
LAAADGGCHFGAAFSDNPDSHRCFARGFAMTTPQDAPNRPDPQLGEAAALGTSGMGEAIRKDGEAVVKEVEGASRQWMNWAHKAGQANLKAWQALMGCRTAKDVAAVHSGLMQQHLDLMTNNSPRLTPAVAKPAPTRRRAPSAKA